jgi:hypothetical protein
MKLSCSIMAHRSRADLVEELCAALDRDVPVAWDPNYETSKDPERRWHTGSLAWQLAEEDSDWHIVLQDDAMPVPDLLAGLEKGLEYVTEPCVVQPHIGARKPHPGRVNRLTQKGDRYGAAWLTSDYMLWGIAVCMPTGVIPDMLEWSGRQKGRAYDRRIANYFRDRLGWQTWHTWPSLVEHRPGPSLCGHGPYDRSAHRMWNRSALEFPFNGPVIG